MKVTIGFKNGQQIKFRCKKLHLDFNEDRSKVIGMTASDVPRSNAILFIDLNEVVYIKYSDRHFRG